MEDMKNFENAQIRNKWRMENQSGNRMTQVNLRISVKQDNWIIQK